VILGIGADLVDIPRVSRLLAAKGERALKRLFTEQEAAYALARGEPARHLAARVAAKEATYKALSGVDAARLITWREIEVVPTSCGSPELRLHGLARRRAEELEVSRLWLTLTHSAQSAAAFVILEGVERLLARVDGS
jgi:holo-[acyl-carrier protein] synthase